MALRPVPGLLQAPAIDDIANQVDAVGIIVFQEIEQELRLAAARAQMQIGDEDCAIAAIERCGDRFCVHPDTGFCPRDSEVQLRTRREISPGALRGDDTWLTAG